MTRHILLFIQQSFRLVKTTGLQTTRYVALPNRREISISLISVCSNFSNLLFLCSTNLIMFSVSVSGVQKLYELVVRHFLACCSQPAVGAETTVEVDIAGEQFNASGRIVLAVSILKCCCHLLLLLTSNNLLPILQQTWNLPRLLIHWHGNVTISVIK